MPHSETHPGHDLPVGEILTLSEVAEYLRVPEEAVLELVRKDALPGQQLGGEWRFSKRAVVEWLRFGRHFPGEFRLFPPPWMLDHPIWEDLFQVLEHRIINKLSTSGRLPAKPGSKEAVLRHHGVFREDADIEEQIAGIRARRKAAGE